MDGQGKSHQARECVGSPSNHDSVLFSTYDVRPSPGANIDNSCRWRNNTVEDPVTITVYVGLVAIVILYFTPFDRTTSTLLCRLKLEETKEGEFAKTRIFELLLFSPLLPKEFPNLALGSKARKEVTRDG